MKQIIAYIRPDVLERVTEALRSIHDLTGMSSWKQKVLVKERDLPARTRAIRRSLISAKRSG